jgi:hypothetical protein
MFTILPVFPESAYVVFSEIVILVSFRGYNA